MRDLLDARAAMLAGTNTGSRRPAVPAAAALFSGCKLRAALFR
jgi:hypothetical protein